MGNVYRFALLRQIFIIFSMISSCLFLCFMRYAQGTKFHCRGRRAHLALSRQGMLYCMYKFPRPVCLGRAFSGGRSMPFLVTDSAVPLPAETLPALKLTHHYDAPAAARCMRISAAMCTRARCAITCLCLTRPRRPRHASALRCARRKARASFCLPLSAGRGLGRSGPVPGAAGRRLRRRAGLFCPGGKAQRGRGRAGPILVCRGRAARAGAARGIRPRRRMPVNSGPAMCFCTTPPRPASVPRSVRARAGRLAGQL